MKKIFLIAMLCAVFKTGVSQTISKNTTENFARLEWLQGKWISLSGKPGQSGHERWVKSSPTAFRGYGVTTKDGDTLFIEKLTILIKDDNIYYVADVPENRDPVYFKLTAITGTGFVCENPAHDFPKKIEYRHEQNSLKATISGDGKAVTFKFRKE